MKNPIKKFAKKPLLISFFIALVITLPFLVVPNLYAQLGNNLGLTGNSNSKSCASGLSQFTAAGIGYESFKDYFADFAMWPSQYADVAAVSQQVDKARYAVVAAFLRCDTNQLKVVTDAYYKLEAELYFVRHFVDTSDGTVKDRSKIFEEREKFIADMTDFYILRKKSQDKEKDAAVLAGYFNEFSTKWEAKAKTYASVGKDPAFKDLSAKFDELIQSFKNITKVADGLGTSKDKPAQDDSGKTKSGDAPAVAGPPKTLKEKAEQVFTRLFNACVTTPNEKYCIGGSTPPSNPVRQTPGSKQTFDDVVQSVQTQILRQTKDTEKAEMLTRYTILYGDVSGGGSEQILGRLDTLNKLITDGINGDAKQGSFDPLSKVKQCAATVLAKECK